jgi:hypothetical protein
MSAPAADVSNAKADVKPDSMRFEWRAEGPADRCGESCRTWISAVGAITEDTPADFEAFIAGRKANGALVVIDSEGGSVLGAMALGRAFRKLDLTTSVGRTSTSGSGDKATVTIAPDAYCQSMCAFLLLGGTRRFVPAEARVMVHQIWLAKKAKRSLEANYSAEELGRVQRDIGSLARYTVEMGGGIELLETALRIPPWEPMYRLTADEVRRMKLTTLDHRFADEVPTASISKSQPPILTAVHAGGE